MKILEKDLPSGLHHLLTYWQGEEVSREILSKICDDEISEEEEVKMFLEWCQRYDNLSSLEKETKQELRELLKENPSYLTQEGKAMM